MIVTDKRQTDGGTDGQQHIANVIAENLYVCVRGVCVMH